MRRKVLLMALLISTAGMVAKTLETGITFKELPYSEGTLYVAVEDDGKNVFMKGMEVEGDSVSFVVDLSGYDGKQLVIKAFQDLNDNRRLDMDTYGRPTEPCLQATFTPDPDHPTHTFRLIQY